MATTWLPDEIASQRIFWRQSVAVQRINSNDPQAWLVDTWARIATHPAQRLDELLMSNWTAITAAAA